MPQAVPIILKAASFVAKYWKVISTVASVAYSVKSSLDAKKAARRLQDRMRGTLYSTRAAAAPRRIVYGRTRIGGLEVYVTTGGTNNEYLDVVMVWCDGPVQAIEKIYFNDVLAFSGTTAQGEYSGHVTVSHHLGTEAQSADSSAVTNISQWTSSHKLSGVAYSYFRLSYDESVFASGVPSISAIIQGRSDVYDPRLNSGAGGTAYTNNVALCAVHYMTLSRFGPNAGYATEIDETALTAAANICDESVALAGGGTEARYTFDGTLFADASPEENLQAFRAAMAGVIAYVGGRWQVLPGVYRAPTFEITADLLAGPIQYTPSAGKRSLANTVKGIFAREAELWQPTDYPARIDSAAVTADGEEITMDLPLPYSGSASRAQRIAQIELNRQRTQGSLRLRCNIEALRAEVGQTVSVTLPRYGFDEAVFVVDGWSLAVEDAALYVDLTLSREASSVYDWTAGADEVASGTATAPANQVAKPYAIPAGGDYAAALFPFEVTLSCSTPQAAIRWSYSSAPATSADGNAYSGRIVVDADDIIYARAFKAGMSASSAMTETYTESGL